jgi:hypothetical protein
MKRKMLAVLLLVLSAGAAQAGAPSKKMTCDDCTPECLKNPYGKGCPAICREPECQTSCDNCAPECRKNPYKSGCPEICKDVKCQTCDDCTPECKKNPAAEGCPDICKDIKCYTCDDCSAECVINPDGKDCPPVCGDLNCNVCDKFPKDCPASCKDNPDDPEKCPPACKGAPEKCLLEKKVTCDDCPPECEDNPEKCPAECKDLGCYPEKKHDLGLVADFGYFLQSDPADYLFGRIGAEYKLSKQFSVLGMVGGAAQIDGTDGDDALMLDVTAQYHWTGPVDGFFGLGLGGWITSGDVDDDSGDSDLDLIANLGARVYGEPDAFNVSCFLEMRSAVDEFDSIAEYARFGGGLRFKF